MTLAVLQSGSRPTYSQQALDEHCVVSVLNRTAQVRADGSWTLPNIPAGFGPVRARATCVENGVTRSGQSELFTITPGRMNAIPPIVLGPTTPIPQTMAIAGNALLTAVGATSQLTVTATYAGEATQDVTAAAAGTTYSTTNALIASVGTGGLVTAVRSGTVIIRATNEGTAGLLQVRVQLTGDSDGDGIPDDIEIAEGLNPNNPVDALEDADRDGLSNLAEFDRGTLIRDSDSDDDTISDGEEVVAGADGFITNPLLADTDGDGVRDALEIASGSDPGNAGSLNLTQALNGITVAPQTFALTVNSVIGEASQQLTVTGQLKDGTSINLTSHQSTNYLSSDILVCNFGAEPGRVFAAADGQCIITVTSSGFTAESTGTISSFQPAPLSFVAIAGFANNVDVSGNIAYVAAGATGLQVVSVSNRLAPVVVAALDTPGNANDVRVVGNLAYVADGSSGLRIIDVTNPLAPVAVGAFDTPGDALDVVVSGNRAYVADGPAGLRIIDVSNPANPQSLGTVNPSGDEKGVDVDPLRNLAVVALGTSGLQIIDVANPANPTLVGFLGGGDVRDVALKGSYAFLADQTRSLTSVDLTNPASPQLRASTPLTTGGRLNDVVVSGNFALGADVLFVNGVPVVDISNEATPLPRAILNFSNFRDDDGQGIAADGSFVYLAAVLGSAFTENGSTGNSRLYIGQYLAQQDLAGVAPSVVIASPADGSTFIEGQQVPVSVTATDDVSVVAVNLLVNGQVVATDTSFPYQFSIAAPLGVAGATLGATAFDLGGNVGTASQVAISFIPDPGTQVIGTVTDRLGNPVAGATVTCLNLTAISGPGGTFAIQSAPTVQGNIVCTATIVDGAGKTLRGASQPRSPVAGGTTEVGEIRVTEGNVLILADADTPGTTALVNALVAAGNTVTLRQPPEYTWDGTNPALTGFNVVIHLNGATYFSPLPVAAQIALTNFVANGGGFIGSQWNGYERNIGAQVNMNDLVLQGYPGPLNCGNCSITYNVVPGQGNHPVLAGVPSSFTFFADGNSDFAEFTYAVNPVTVLMRTQANGPAVLVRQFGSGRVVNFSHSANYLQSGSAGVTLTDPNIQRLYINAVAWASGGQ